MISKKFQIQLDQMKKLDKVASEIDWQEMAEVGRQMAEVRIPITDDPLSWSAAFASTMTLLERGEYTEMTGYICRLIVLAQDIKKMAGLKGNEDLRIFEEGKDEI